MTRYVARHPEHFIVAALAVALLIGIAATFWSRDTSHERRAAASSATTTEGGTDSLPRCRDVAGGFDVAVNCRTANASLVIVPPDRALDLPDLTARLLGASTLQASTPSGRARKRMRVTVHLQVTNAGEEPLVTGRGERFFLSVAGTRIRSDPAAAGSPGSLLAPEPLAPDDTRVGTLRFELGGRHAEQLLTTARADLGVREPRAGPGGDLIGIIRLRLD